MKVDKIDISKVVDSFDEYLSEDHNKRIIFTGKFGTGKTTFIRDFFDTRKKDFNYVLISPVNYSVGSNEDVFEYIKLDVIQELLDKYQIKSIKEKIPESLYLWSYVNNRFESVFDLFLTITSSIEPTTNVLKKMVDSFNKNYALYKKYKEELDQSNQTSTEVFLKRIKNEKNKIGSIFENDLVTESIRIYLKNLKTSRKENVLIIDDFDRIDPDHIFRIFNVLSVHSDYLKGKYFNKFDFDRIIIVCDIDSIENYYYHKYGKDANFNGFIDKFSSSYYFRFSNKSAVINYCNSSILKRELPESARKVLSILLQNLIDEDYLSLRNLLKFNLRNQKPSYMIHEDFDTGLEKHCKTCTFISAEKLSIDTSDFPFLKAINILVNIIGDYDKLINVCDELSESGKSIQISRNDIPSFLDNLVLLKHLQSLNRGAEGFLYKLQQGPNGRHYGPSDGIHIENPTVRFIETPVLIKLKWNKENQFKEEDRYFENASFINRSSESKFLFLRYYYQELSSILKFLQKEYTNEIV